ncbi:NAD(P)-dependent alcohol dehydrogenase [Pandoraea apista]|uniref:NAD(P)-dependent alcohol dehydrogenase n=2 Tax=Pandoraea apista TaxID=93218 RepID=A0ABX9ZKP7_9BURK|nr:alcohol dehydrogenase [Pandoraea apista]AKH71073.1 alcohol dehydrogenase [Pandoraea apista]AKI63344.1 alcohol dehydrogenase [Pandoraea apista]ALS67554.1 alcohol dehydrogenase [Pandoraea apista]AVF41712.1 NAD(P)-dependent alcohol dehydrogenase [Pandoraea apista]
MTTMQQWQMATLGEAALERVGVDIPQPGPGEVLVKVGAVSLNYRDALMIDTGMGLPVTFPFVPGSDMAGEVVAVGAGVTRVVVGERVVNTFWDRWIGGERAPEGLEIFGGTLQGVLREYAVFHEASLVHAPETLDDVAASTLTCAGLTAWFALFGTGRKLAAGETVLLIGTGGVALFGAQLALAHGAKVIVTSGSEAKLARVAALGVTHGVRRREGWAQEVLELTQGRGVEQVLELAGGDMRETMTALAPGGKVSVIGMLGGDTLQLPVYPVLLKRAHIQGIGVGHRDGLEALVAAIDRHGIAPVVDAVYDFADVDKALAHLRRGAFGKVVVRLAGPVA